MVWKKSGKLGCGFSHGIVVCHYCEEEGNKKGRYDENVPLPDMRGLNTLRGNWRDPCGNYYAPQNASQFGYSISNAFKFMAGLALLQIFL